MAYPSETGIYDPNRSDWLPYWFDNMTEANRRVGLANLNSGNPLLIASGKVLLDSNPISDSKSFPTITTPLPGANAIVIPTTQEGLTNPDLYGNIPSDTFSNYAGGIFNTVPSDSYNYNLGNQSGDVIDEINKVSSSSGIPSWIWVGGLALVGILIVRK